MAHVGDQRCGRNRLRRELRPCPAALTLIAVAFVAAELREQLLAVLRIAVLREKRACDDRER